MKRIASITLLAGLFAVLAPSVVDAELIIYVYQDGNGNVVASGSGTLDTTDLNNGGSTSGNASVDSSNGFLVLGTVVTTSFDYLLYITGPSSFGTLSTSVEASTASGDSFGVYATSDALFTPIGYVSGSYLSGTSTWDSNTLAGLGLTVGTYTYSWGSNSDADSLVIYVGTPPVPEPSTFLLMGTGLVGMAARGFLRKRAATA